MSFFIDVLISTNDFSNAFELDCRIPKQLIKLGLDHRTLQQLSDSGAQLFKEILNNWAQDIYNSLLHSGSYFHYNHGNLQFPVTPNHGFTGLKNFFSLVQPNIDAYQFINFKGWNLTSYQVIIILVNKWFKYIIPSMTLAGLGFIGCYLSNTPDSNANYSNTNYDYSDNNNAENTGSDDFNPNPTNNGDGNNNGNGNNNGDGNNNGNGGGEAWSNLTSMNFQYFYYMLNIILNLFSILGSSTYPLLNWLLRTGEITGRRYELYVLRFRLLALTRIMPTLDNMRYHIRNFDRELYLILAALTIPSYRIRVDELRNFTSQTRMNEIEIELNSIIRDNFDIFNFISDEETVILSSHPNPTEFDILPWADIPLVYFDYIQLITNENQLRAQLHVPDNLSLVDYIGVSFEQIMVLFDAFIYLS